MTATTPPAEPRVCKHCGRPAINAAVIGHDGYRPIVACAPECPPRTPTADGKDGAA